MCSILFPTVKTALPQPLYCLMIEEAMSEINEQKNYFLICLNQSTLFCIGLNYSIICHNYNDPNTESETVNKTFYQM